MGSRRGRGIVRSARSRLRSRKAGEWDIAGWISYYTLYEYRSKLVPSTAVVSYEFSSRCVSGRGEPPVYRGRYVGGYVGVSSDTTTEPVRPS